MALQGFDEAYYLSAKLAALAVEYPEWATKTTDDLKAFMANVGFTPESHYSQIGYTEGLAPNAYFNHNEYTLAKAQQLFDANLYGSISEAQAAFEAAWTGDAYLHYLQYGAAEGINPSNDFDASSYLADKLADLQADSATAADWADKTEADVLAAFTAAGLTPLTHYIAFGEDEGLTVTEVPADEQVDPGELTPTEGEVFTLTTGVDTITGTAANDTINGSDTTVTGLDVVNGGEGTDTLNISDVAGAAADLTLLSVSNVENLVLTSTTSLDSAAANVSSWTGLTSAKFDLRNVAADQAVTVADTTAVEVTAKVTTAAALDINGGTTVVATVNNTVDNSAKTITVDGGAATSAVTVAQSAATATHAAAVTITDKNAASDTTADTITTVTLSGLKGGVAAINSDALATLNLSSSNQNVTIDNDTADHALALNLNGVTGGIISDVKAKTVTVTNTGAASSGITVTADLATAISFAGDKAVTTNLGATQAANLAITVTNTAGVTIGTALDTDVSFTGAAGADSVIVGATTKAIAMGAGNDTVAMSVAVGTGGSVDAGEGTDTLAMLSASAAAVSANATFESGVSNFEKVSLAATLAAAADTVNMANLDDINYLVSAGVIATGALTVTNMAANSTFELTGLVAGASSLALTDATGSADVINLKFSAADGFTSTAALTVAGVETINITTDDTDTTAPTTVFTQAITAAAAKSVVVTGDVGINLTGLTTTTLTSLDASGVTATGAAGAVTLTTGALAAAATLTTGAGDDLLVATAATKAVTITTNDGNDTVTVANAQANVITTGAGNDIITVGTGANTIDAGAGDDSITVGASAGLTTINVGAGTDTVVLGAVQTAAGYYTSVTGMAAGDMIDFAAVGTVAAEATLGSAIALGAASTFANYLDAATAGNATGAVNWFQYNGNTYVTVDAGAAGVFTDGTDTVIELVGLVNLSTSVVAAEILTLA